jgi:hypothetical protein
MFDIVSMFVQFEQKSIRQINKQIDALIRNKLNYLSKLCIFICLLTLQSFCLVSIKVL